MSLRDRIDFVLVETSEGGNVGSAARALANTGFSRLSLVRPAYDHPASALAHAVHADGLVREAKVFDSLKEAVAEAGWVVGISARARTHADRKPPLGPAELIAGLEALPKDTRVALVFGTERTGLSNAQLGICQDLLRLPTWPDYPSLNLAAAVLVVAWEIHRHELGFSSTAPANPDMEQARAARKPLAAGAIEGLLSHAQRTLEIIGYLNPQNPRIVLDDLRKVFSRAGLDDRELSMFRGIFHKMDGWIAHHGGPPSPNQPRGQAQKTAKKKT